MKVFTTYQCPVQIAKFLYWIYGPKYCWPMMLLDSFFRIISRRNWWVQLGITRHAQNCLKMMNFKLFILKLKFLHSIFQIYSQIFWSAILKEGINPAGIYLSKVHNKNTRTMFEICSKLKAPERRRCCGIFIVNFEQISPVILVFLLLTLNK